MGTGRPGAPPYRLLSRPGLDQISGVDSGQRLTATQPVAEELIGDDVWLVSSRRAVAAADQSSGLVRAATVVAQRATELSSEAQKGTTDQVWYAVWPFKWDTPSRCQRISSLGFRAVELIAWSPQQLTPTLPSRHFRLRSLIEGQGLVLSQFVSTPEMMAHGDPRQHTDR